MSRGNISIHQTAADIILYGRLNFNDSSKPRSLYPELLLLAQRGFREGNKA